MPPRQSKGINEAARQHSRELIAKLPRDPKTGRILKRAETTGGQSSEPPAASGESGSPKPNGGTPEGAAPFGARFGHGPTFRRLQQRSSSQPKSPSK
jgi:hypothetical protein